MSLSPGKIFYPQQVVPTSSLDLVEDFTDPTSFSRLKESECYQIELFHKITEETFVLEQALLHLQLLEKWNEEILPQIRKIIDVKTPMMVTLLGAVLLKKWGSVQLTPEEKTI